MHAIRAAVGPDLYTNDAGNGWCKIFSALLATIIPAAMKHEIDHPEQAKQQTLERGQMVRSSIDKCVTCVRLQAEFDANVNGHPEHCQFCTLNSSIERITINHSGSLSSLTRQPSAPSHHHHPVEPAIAEEPNIDPASPASPHRRVVVDSNATAALQSPASISAPISVDPVPVAVAAATGGPL